MEFDTSMKPSRRNVLAMSAGLPAAATLATSGRAETNCSDAETLSLEISQKLFGADGLAQPVPNAPTKSDLAASLDRTLVLGGGGEYYVAWYCGFFHGLIELGVDPARQAELVVGTSAGAYIGSSMTSGHFQRLRSISASRMGIPPPSAPSATLHSPPTIALTAPPSSALRGFSPATARRVGRLQKWSRPPTTVSPASG
jgi:hypothetical protein